jgi:hypothetical protein
MTAHAALRRTYPASPPPAWMGLRTAVIGCSAMRLQAAHYQRMLGLVLGRLRERVRVIRTFSAAAFSDLRARARHALQSAAQTRDRFVMLLAAWRVPRVASIAFRAVGCAFAAGAITLAFLNNRAAGPEEIASVAVSPAELSRNETVAVRNETVVVRQERQPHIEEQLPSFNVDNEEEIAIDESEQAGVFRRAIQTVRFLNPSSGAAGRAIAKLGGFVGFPGNQPVPPLEKPEKIKSARGGAVMEEVDLYLWEVYQRSPTKKDGSGDFTWKDPAAAKNMGIPLPDYVIGGMDPEFREQLYHAGRAMDAEGIQWSILSGFRDDYRQGLASGFKASVGGSLHGGSKRTGGYGFGRAVDITNADGNPETVWNWIDKHGAKYGLHRPMPGKDPAHLQSRGDWQKVAQSLRDSRKKAIAQVGPEKEGAKQAGKQRASAKKVAESK